MELRLCPFSMVPLPSFVGNLSKQLPKIRSVDGSWNSWLAVIKDGDQLYLFFYYYSFWKSDLQNCVVLFICMDSEQKLLLLKVAVCRIKHSRHRWEYCFAEQETVPRVVCFRRSCLQQLVAEVTEVVLSRCSLSSLLHFNYRTRDSKRCRANKHIPKYELKDSTFIMCTQFC